MGHPTAELLSTSCIVAERYIKYTAVDTLSCIDIESIVKNTHTIRQIIHLDYGLAA